MRSTVGTATDANAMLRVLWSRIGKPLSKDVDALQPHIRAFVERAVTFTTCPTNCLKLATHMGADGSVYVLDEPTTGLHLADLQQLLGLLDKLVDAGKSVIVIEHHQAVMAHADWIIDLGPGAGHEGGKIVFEGSPAQLVAAKSTLTAKHLAAFITGATKANLAAKK